MEKEEFSGLSFISLILIMMMPLFITACVNDKSANESVMFTSDKPNPGENSLFLVQDKVTENSIEVLLISSKITVDRIYGLAFDLDFDPHIIRFIELEKGSFLEDKDKVIVNYLSALQSDNNAKLVLGISQQGNMAGVTGQGIIARFKFEAVAAGTSILQFSNNSAKNPSLETISGITWHGGSVRVEM
ncbi:cohesin domain-containing protein [candidate division CSSED10-310 bacterium]|uniref:Cohesin domain-containing protein n=1 Tax=candidate division CSSED10-310 bacterium TaxID=2855610 RepID=A0ABV6Z3K7_UNCC1